MSTEQTNNDPAGIEQTGSEKTRSGGRRWLGIGAAVVALAVGSLVVSTLSPFGLAGAQDNGSPSPASTEPESGGADADSEKKSEEDCDEKHKRLGRFKKGVSDRLAPLAEALGMDVEEVAEALKGGQTVADLAGDRVDEVIAALVQNMTEQIQAKVDDGSIDQDKADEMIAGLEEKVTAFVNGERPDGFDKGHKRGKGPRGFSGFKDGNQAGAAAEKTAA